MVNDKPLDGILSLLDEGNPEEAAKTTIEYLSEVAGERRAIVRVLDTLYRENNDAALAELIERLHGARLMPRDVLTFTLRMAFRAGQYDKALEAVEALLAQSEINVEALRTGGRIGNILENDDIALHYWELLAAAIGTDGEAPLQAARVRARRGEFAEALDWAVRASELQPEIEEPLQIAVKAALAVGWSPRGDEALVRLFGLNEELALVYLGRLKSREGRETVARALSALVLRYPEAAELAKIADEVYAEWLTVGNEYEVGCHDLEAAACYRAARLLRPDQADGQRGIDRLLRYCMISTREADQGQDFDTVLQYGGLATAIDPSCFEAWQLTGRAHLHHGDLANSSQAFARCIELRPGDLASWLDYGRVQRQRGDTLGALKAFQKVQALTIARENAEISHEAETTLAALYPVLVQEVRAAIKEGDAERAWEYYWAAAEIEPDGAELQPIKRAMMRALREEIQELWRAQSAEVVGSCRKFVELSPQDPWVLTVLGRTLMRLRNYREALPVWESLASLNPGDGHCHLQVARCCNSLKLRDKGLAAAGEALRRENLQEAAALIESLEKLPVPA